MMRSLYTASTGMYAQQMNIDTLAHNMSNVTTTGFKRQRVEFQDLLYQNIRRPIANEDLIEPSGLAVGLGVHPVVSYTLFTQGNLQETGNPMDVAIQGTGFFKVEVPGYDDYLYTREELQSFVPDIKNIADSVTKMIVMFNNCHAGKSVINAKQLMGMLP